ncbi:MAG: hypothetical protein ACKVII_16230 [Planctomycetales bacterium]|jgi:hypothetical protein
MFDLPMLVGGAHPTGDVENRHSANGGNAMIVTLCQIGNDASDSCL